MGPAVQVLDPDRWSMHDNANPRLTPSTAIEVPKKRLWRLIGLQADSVIGIRAALAMLVVAYILPIFLVAAVLFINYYQREQVQLSRTIIHRAQGHDATTARRGPCDPKPPSTGTPKRASVHTA